MPRILLAVTLSLLALGGCEPDADWPVYQGSDNHDHYVTLSQITPANVSQLQVAWTYDTKDAFAGSEMQSNPVIQNGVLYALSPKQRAFALDAATGKELWSFDPTNGAFTGPRIRYRGIVVHDGRVYFNYRYRLFALDAGTGRKVPGWGNDSGWVDLRAGLGRPRRRPFGQRQHAGCGVPGHAHHRHLGSRSPAERAGGHPGVRREDRRHPLDLPHYSAPR